MEDDWSLADWILDAGEAAEAKHTRGERLSPVDKLTRELWVFDMHSLNGGVSQYFCNCADRWSTLIEAALPFPIEPLQLVIQRVEGAISGSSDSYSALLEFPEIDKFYQSNRLVMWRQVQTLATAD